MLKVNVTGVDAVLNMITSYTQRVTEGIAFEMEEGARDILALAVKNLTVNDQGLTRNSIDYVKKDQYDYEVIVSVFWAAYIEFGTGEQFEGQGFDEYARQFKGKRAGATWESFVKNIIAWMKRKGVEPREDQTVEQAAEGIAAWIYFHGLEPHPFLFPALVEMRPKIMARLREVIK